MFANVPRRSARVRTTLQNLHVGRNGLLLKSRSVAGGLGSMRGGNCGVGMYA